MVDSYNEVEDLLQGFFVAITILAKLSWCDDPHDTMLISDHSQGLEADLARPLEGGRS